MRKMNWNSRRQLIADFRVWLFAAVLGIALGGFWLHNQPAAQAAVPATNTLNPTVGASVTWTGDKVGLPPAANGEPSCSNGGETATNCDTFKLVVAPGNWNGKRINVRFAAITGVDYDMVVRRESNGVANLQGDFLNRPAEQNNLDAGVGTSGAAAGMEEQVILSPPNSGETYYVRAIYFAAAALQYQGSAVVEAVTNAAPPAGTCALPTFDNYTPPVGYEQRDNSGEPSIGVNWNTGNVMTMSRLQANRTTFDDSTSPANPNTTVFFPNRPATIVTGLDPIGFTDPITGRSIYGELSGNFTNGIISDDDLSTTVASFQAITAAGAVDHQTIGGGPPNPNVIGRQPLTSYPHLFYYAAQNVGYASVATSFDGGLTYLGSTAAYTLADCNGLHGHIKVAPNDGTVYLPNKGCNGKQGFAVSTDNGLTFTVRTAPNSTSGNTDPSVGIGAGGRVYFAYSAGDNHPHVAISDDRGANFRNDFDLGLAVSPNLTASVFMHVVAGDNNRAAVFFLATNSTNPGDPVGDDAAGPAFAGTWYPYMAVTCDGGESWSVTRADNDPTLAPGTKNPVQQGVICTNGTTCPSGPPDTRNLLDFNEMAVDSRGRITAVYADGCGPEHPCSTLTDNAANTTKENNQGNARLTIIRQRGGSRLFGAFDPAGPSAPRLSPPVRVNKNLLGYGLRWATPDDGGSPITAYRIYRGQPGGLEQMVAEVAPNAYQFNDRLRKAKGGAANYYWRVTAVNQYGESPRNVKTFYAGEF